MIVHLKKKKLLWAGYILSGLVLIFSIVYWLWKPGPSSTISYDKKTNGIWAGHQWFSGKAVKSGDSVTILERDLFIQQLRIYGIRTVFVHAGPILPDGSIADQPARFFNDLQNAAPEIRFLPWIGGDVRRYDLESPRWRASLISTIKLLHSQGVKGIHIDIEPLESFHPGYIELLKELRSSFKKPFFISHATRRVAPFECSFWPVKTYFWTASFYKACMKFTDQTVLMGYDTCLKLKKLYTGSISMQTKKLLECTADFPNHSLMIGIPSYSDNLSVHDPRVENIQTAVPGIRAALEKSRHNSDNFEGVAIYAHWTTDPEEWQWYEVYWMQRY
ncbi:MAG: hypothetical protein JW915_19845 [Chitinispirillaceae bacterium]|nr:hypothetical protein [Chitinispirillaceae bacterium]